MKKLDLEVNMVLKISNYLSWIDFQETVEVVLKQEGLQKIQTPYLVVSGAMESQLETFKTERNIGTTKQNLELPTSPEFHLKKALAMGLKDIFEIKTCFRNEESSDHHSSEFTMLEFYKVDIKLEDFANYVLGVLAKIGRALKINNQDRKPIIYKIAGLFHNIGIHLDPQTQLKDLKLQAHRLGVLTSESDSLDDIYFRVWLEKIEPHFVPDTFTLVHSYPPSQAALAKIGEDGWAKRFEIYYGQLELGNAYEELGDSKSILARWQQENAKRVASHKVPHTIDEDFLKALDLMPPCCGIAIGLERLFMAFYNFKKISDFKIF